MMMYDEMRKQARELGPREVVFRFEYSTDEGHITIHDVVEEVENRYGPRDGPPEITAMWWVATREADESSEWNPIAIATIEVHAKINRFVFSGDPEKDRVDTTEVGYL